MAYPRERLTISAHHKHNLRRFYQAQSVHSNLGTARQPGSVQRNSFCELQTTGSCEELHSVSSGDGRRCLGHEALRNMPGGKEICVIRPPHAPGDFWQGPHLDVESTSARHD